jgi:hypothetical protein
MSAGILPVISSLMRSGASPSAERQAGLPPCSKDKTPLLGFNLPPTRAGQAKVAGILEHRPARTPRRGEFRVAKGK